MWSNLYFAVSKAPPKAANADVSVKKEKKKPKKEEAAAKIKTESGKL